MLSEDVENEMSDLRFEHEAEFCRVFREGLFISDDKPGLPAFERCKKRHALIEWLDRRVDFGVFPPFGGKIMGFSHILYQGLRTSHEYKMYLSVIANAGTYCVRAPNTLCSESFFGSMQDGYGPLGPRNS
ncbi:hypothetical protein DPMN_083816 [Dreissena polymorpha]|uniref:Uncharacterized protein n=1 Tax=Dreissena polymorpha TaxID=45954 RepID=A0A9D4BIN5_DREPO|nr:hypothetical protein DPMN_083816 [Dreissena polymorpha]